MITWQNIKYFKPEEFTYKDPKTGAIINCADKMNMSFIAIVDTFRHIYGKPLRVSASYDVDGHSQSSQHYTGSAVDLIPLKLESKVELLDMYLLAEKMTFGGIGLYGWGFPGSWRNPGLHLDFGPAGRRWAVNDKESNYVSLNGEYIKRMLS